MSSKKLLVGTVSLALLCGIVYGVFTSREKNEDEGSDSVAESNAEAEFDDAAPTAYESPDVAQENHPTIEEPIPDEEIIMSTSAGVAKRAKLAEELESGQRGITANESDESVNP